MLREREQNSAGLKYTTRLHESRKPSILKCLFHNSHKNSFFSCLGFLKKKNNTQNVSGEALVVEKSRIARRENNKKKYSHRDLNTDDGRRRKKAAHNIARVRKTSSVSMCCCCGAMHNRRWRVYDERSEAPKNFMLFVDDFARIHETSSSFSARDRLLLVVSTSAFSERSDSNNNNTPKTRNL